MKIILLLFVSVNLNAMTLDEYLKTIAEKNKLVASYDLSIEASKDKMIAGDLLLSPVLTLGYLKMSDKSLPTTVADKRDTTIATMGLAKKFSSGTQLSLSAEADKFEYEQPLVVGNNGYSKGGLGVSIQQSLWKDFFGSATRLRKDREVSTNKLETLGYELKKRMTLIEVESDYWDYIVAQEDLKLKQANLDRAKKLETWTQNRVNNGISDQSDLLQLSALTARREVELAVSQDELKFREAKVRENLNLQAADVLPVFTSNLQESRSQILLVEKQKDLIRIDSYMASLESDIKQRVSEEVVDSLRPDLALVGKYNTSSYDTDQQQMLKNIDKTDRPITYVGLNLTWMFGSDAVSSQLGSARKEALSSRYRAEQLKISGQNAWSDFLRKFELTKKNVITLERITRIQKERSKQEQIKFTKGRTITSNVVGAETDSAEADVAFLKAKSGLRKLESSSQLYISITE